MHESAKLAEAEFFLAEAGERIADPEAFRYMVSAFLSASRSAVDYARREAFGHAGGQKWYDTFISGEPVMRFLADERNLNTHERPTQPGGHVDVYADDRFLFGESAVVEDFDRDGNLVRKLEPVGASEDAGRADEAAAAPEVQLEFHYRFDGWQGPEEIPELMRKYLDAIRRFLADGRKSGFIGSR